MRRSFISQTEVISYTENGEWIVKCPHPECEKCAEKFYIINNVQYNDRRRSNIEPCTRIQPIGSGDSTGEREVAEFVKTIMPIERKLRCLYINESTHPSEIDIYMPSLKLGIEYNGLYWHSLEHDPDKERHFKKWLAAKEQGIRLITIWEHWWLERREDCKQFLKDQILNGRSDIKFFNDDFIHLDACSEEEWESIDPNKVQLYKQEVEDKIIVDGGMIKKEDL